MAGRQWYNRRFRAINRGNGLHCYGVGISTVVSLQVAWWRRKRCPFGSNKEVGGASGL